jgi:nitronate monooxygenase
LLVALPDVLANNLSLPVIASPLFIISTPPLVAAQCRAGIVGSFPALNARPDGVLDSWIAELTQDLAAHRKARPGAKIAPFAVNQIIHKSNVRLDKDMATCIRHRVPLLITSLAVPSDFIDDVHTCGGLIFHDVTTVRHAEKAIAAGVDGLILVCAGAGGHAGTASPMALVGEIRRFFDGPLVLGGAIASGAAILAALALGADLAYIGTRFIATDEANADARYKQMLVDSGSADIVYSSLFTGVNGNYLKPSITAAGLDPDALPQGEKSALNFGGGSIKAWRDVWGAGQGVGVIDGVAPAGEVVAELQNEYLAARQRLALSSS